MNHHLSRLPLALVLVLLCGCSSPGRTVTGSTTFRRTVSVGGEVIIRLPATMGSREWQLTKFDSLKLPITTPLQLQGNSGNQEWVARFVARHAGETQIEFTRVAALPAKSDTVGERRLYRFWIRD